MVIISAKSKNQLIRFMKSDDASRILGWFLLPLSSLGLLLDLQQYGGINIAYGVLTILSLWLIVRAAGIWDISDSKEEMLRHASASKHAKHVHHSTRVGLLEKKQLGAVLVILFCFGVAILTIGMHLLFGASPSIFLLVLQTVALGTMLVTASRHRGWFLVASSSSAAALLSSVTFLLPENAYSSERLLSSYLAVAYIVVTFWAVSRWRRTIESNTMGVVVIMTSGLVYLTLIGFLSNYASQAAWQVAFLSLSGIALGFATLAWIRNIRQSFAKHYLSLSLVVLMIWSYLFLNETIVITILLMAAITAILLGFLASSYTARIVGLSLLSLGTLQYLLMLQAGTAPIIGSVWLSSSLLLGLVSLTVLAVTFLLYYSELITFKPKEAILKDVILQGVAVAWWGIVLVLCIQLSSGFIQTLLFTAWGVLVLGIGKKYCQPTAQVAGAAGIVLALFQFLAVDIPAFQPLGQAIGFITFAMIVLTLAIIIAQQYVSHKKHSR